MSDQFQDVGIRGPASGRLPDGSTIGAYRIERLLDRGGMAYVYDATDVRLGRRVALKVLAPELFDREGFRERFLRESRFAASLDHPNIVPVFEAGDADGVLYIAMRLVRGPNLRDLIGRRGTLDPATTLAILTPVADALDTAHAAGLVHRDVKPGNILLTDPDTGSHTQVYLGDFGLTTRASAPSTLTVAGHFLGTIAYTAPEQIRGEPLDGRTDLYALACVAYECLIGRTPFVRDDSAALLWAHLNDDPAAVPSGRADLRSAAPVLERGMARDRRDRYRSGAQFIAALSAVLGIDPPTVTGQSTSESPVPSAASTTGYQAGLDSVQRGSAGAAAAIRVFLVDDHEVVRRGVADLLEEDQGLTVVGQASSVAEALRRVVSVQPDVAVLDMRLPDGNGVELCRELRSRMPELHCLMLTSFADEDAMMDAILAGASGYVIKDIKGLDLVSAVRAVGAGGSLLDGTATTALMNRLRSAAALSGPIQVLSDRERAVLDLIGVGLTNRRIADRLGITEKKVRHDVSRILAAMGLRRRMEVKEVVTGLRPGRADTVDGEGV